MKIFFGASTSQFPKYKEYYFSIRNFIVSEGHVITRDWLQMYKDKLLEEKLEVAKPDTRGNFYELAVKAVYAADILIVEDTVPSFSNGHLMTLALLKKTPVLVLWIKDEKKSYLKTKFIHGIKSNYLQINEYTLDNYQDVIRSFIKKFEEHYKKYRFHLVIDEVEKKYLDWAQNKYDKSKTEIIRDSIRDKLNKDRKYDEYLKV